MAPFSQEMEPPQFPGRFNDNPDETRLKDKKSFEEKIPSIIKTKLQEEGFKVVSNSPDKKENLVTVSVKIKYDPGNRALRWVGGLFGAGKGTIDAYIEAIDPVTGILVASQKEIESKSMGAGGGNFYSMAEDTVEGITESLAEDLSKIRR